MSTYIKRLWVKPHYFDKNSRILFNKKKKIFTNEKYKKRQNEKKGISFLFGDHDLSHIDCHAKCSSDEFMSKWFDDILKLSRLHCIMQKKKEKSKNLFNVSIQRLFPENHSHSSIMRIPFYFLFNSIVSWTICWQKHPYECVGGNRRKR